MTRRLAPLVFLNSRMSARNLLGKIHLVLALLDVGPVDLLDVVVIEDGRARSDGREKWLQLLEQTIVEHPRIRGRFVHVVFENVPSGEDQIVKSRPAERTLSPSESGRRCACLRRMVPICVSEPMGLARPLRMASTPATKVVATAPIPGIMTPSLPFAGSMVPLSFPAEALGCPFGAGAGGQIHLAAGALGVSQSSFAMLMFARGGGGRKLFAVTVSVGIPPIGHEYSGLFLVHFAFSWWRWLVTATDTGDPLTLAAPFGKQRMPTSQKCGFD